MGDQPGQRFILMGSEVLRAPPLRTLEERHPVVEGTVESLAPDAPPVPGHVEILEGDRTMPVDRLKPGIHAEASPPSMGLDRRAADSRHLAQNLAAPASKPNP